MRRMRMVMGWEQFLEADRRALPALNALCQALEMKTHWDETGATLYIEAPVAGKKMAVLAASLTPDSVDNDRKMAQSAGALLKSAGAAVPTGQTLDADLILTLASCAPGHPWGVAAHFSWPQLLQSRRLASFLADSVATATGLPRLPNRFLWRQPLKRRALSAPSCALHIGAPVTAEERDRMQDPRFHQAVAAGIYQGIARFCASRTLLDLLRTVSVAPEGLWSGYEVQTDETDAPTTQLVSQSAPLLLTDTVEKVPSQAAPAEPANPPLSIAGVPVQPEEEPRPRLVSITFVQEVVEVSPGAPDQATTANEASVLQYPEPALQLPPPTRSLGATDGTPIAEESPRPEPGRSRSKRALVSSTRPPAKASASKPRSMQRAELAGGQGALPRETGRHRTGAAPAYGEFARLTLRREQQGEPEFRLPTFARAGEQPAAQNQPMVNVFRLEGGPAAEDLAEADALTDLEVWTGAEAPTEPDTAGGAETQSGPEQPAPYQPPANEAPNRQTAPERKPKSDPGERALARIASPRRHKPHKPAVTVKARLVNTLTPPVELHSKLVRFP